MGMTLSIFEGAVPRFPLEIKMTLECDGGTLLCGRQQLQHSDGFMGCYRTAMQCGWKDTNRGGRRVFLGPCCSRKAVDTTYSVAGDEVDDR